MGYMLRSDKMFLCDLYMQPDAAFYAMTGLGEMCCCQFIDTNLLTPPSQRTFVSEVCRCEEMERKMNFLRAEMVKDSIYFPGLQGKPEPMLLSEISKKEPQFEKWQRDFADMAQNLQTLSHNFLEMAEMYYVLEHIGPILGDVQLSTSKHFEQFLTGGHLVVFTGVLERSRCYAFELMLWRMSKGNLLYRQAQEDRTMTDPDTSKEIWKVAFLIICQGEQLANRVQKVCDGFHAHIYPCPDTADERAESLNNLELRMTDLEQVIKKTKYHRCKALRIVGRNWSTWMASLKKTKAIYHNLNLFNMDVTRNSLIGRCWIPEQDLEVVQRLLADSSARAKAVVPSFALVVETKLTPPTYHRTNTFTRGFQNLINAYGDSTYREVNPGLYTIITFPFLFSIMFGDFGHGILMFLFSYWMVYNEKKFIAQRSTNEIWNIFFNGRYIILLMSIFSIYSGSVYNSILALSANVFKSQWLDNVGSDANIERIPKGDIQLDPLVDSNGRPYWYGVDPIWSQTKNKIVVINSLKMKFSIIIGIIHMLGGLALSLVNHLYFKHTHKIYFEFIPQVVFLTCMFVYLCFMIFFKWFKYSGLYSDQKVSAGCAPLLLIYFIDMVLMGESKPVGDGCDAYMYSGQRQLQMILLFVSLACIPILLLGSPIWVIYKHKMHGHRYSLKIFFPKRKMMAEVHHHHERHHHHHADEFILKDTPAPKPVKPDPDAETDDHRLDVGEMMTHQGVHTIEFVLSTISHTASYLRLWALSLAHEQLAEMLWSMVFSKLALREHSNFGIVKIYIFFPIWACFTVSILVLMEGLSAFLHTLRLHWVEFMSKFYAGSGYKFQPYCFETLLSADAATKYSAFCSKYGKKPKADK